MKAASVIFRSLSLSQTKSHVDQQHNAITAATAAATTTSASSKRGTEDSSSNSSSSSSSVDSSNSNSSSNNNHQHRHVENTPVGADDFLPLFIWVVLRSQIPRLFTNCEYIQAYLNPARLMGKSGYCLINLRSAIEFVSYIEAESINIDPAEFAAQMKSAEEALA